MAYHEVLIPQSKENYRSFVRMHTLTRVPSNSRIMLGAGLIKIRGDECWRDLTCMNYFYETQPNPNPLSYYAHQAPQFWHKFETLGNHIVELVAPW